MRTKLARLLQNLQGERASSLVEMAFASVFLLLLVVAAYEFGMVFSSYAATINASRVGASYASMHPDPGDDEYTRYADLARHEMRAAHLDMSRVEVSAPQTPEGSGPGAPIAVTVTYRLQTFTSGMSLPVFGRLGLPSCYTVSWTAVVPIR